jgi:CheY-like chemotaxis protein
MPPPTNSPCLIYVVDDDPDDFEFLRLSVEENACHLTLKYFEDPREFVDSLDFLSIPGLIILDINMPVLNGFDVLKIMSDKPRWENVPVLIVTTSDGMPDKKLANELQVYDYIVKPSSISKWRHIVDKIAYICNELDRQGQLVTQGK